MIRKWSLESWWFFIKRQFIQILTLGVILGIGFAFHMSENSNDGIIELLLLGILVIGGIMGTLGTFISGTLSWIFSDPELFKELDSLIDLEKAIETQSDLDVEQ